MVDNAFTLVKVGDYQDIDISCIDDLDAIEFDEIVDNDYLDEYIDSDSHGNESD